MAIKSTADKVATIQKGYTLEGPTIELGAAIVDGELHKDAPVRLPLSMMNRHGLVAGATGTGKTVTLHMMAEQLSTAGVPVFLADIKGDLSGLATAAAGSEKLKARTDSIGQPWSGKTFPVEFLALGGDGAGIPVRSTITSFGPILLSRVMELNETQESSLQLVFHFADKNNLELIDLKDLRAVIQFLTSDEGKDELENLGGLSKSTAGVILRELITLEAQGMEKFFGEPEFDTAELLRTAPDGRGVVTCLELPTLQTKPMLFSTFLMWLLADLFEDLPEAGDLDKPKLVFFLDEAHLLFNDASKAFLEAITTTVRLIRSKGVGIFFVTQTPKDVPADVLGQLANYGTAVDNISAYEKLSGKAAASTGAAAPGQPPVPSAGVFVPGSLDTQAVDADARRIEEEILGRPSSRPAPERREPSAPAPRSAPPAGGGMMDDITGALGGALGGGLKSMVRSMGTQLGRELLRGVFGTSSRRR